MRKDDAAAAQDDAGKGVGTDAVALAEARPLRYVNANYVITGVPARDLSADEARVYGATVAAVQAASGVIIYEEVGA